MNPLFEYGKWEPIESLEKEALKDLLKDIWKQRKFVDPDAELTEEKKDECFQPFLRFDDYKIRANNYAGFIQYGEEIIEIYPKVFREQFRVNTPLQDDKKMMLRHIFYWFSYCRRLKFPFKKASLEPGPIDNFPDLIISLMADQFLETISKQPLAMYQELEDALATPRGSINFKRYIANSLSHGNFQQIECDHVPFLYDNNVNRMIKYCTRLLMTQTVNEDNMRLLQEVLFILDEVEDTTFTAYAVDKISLNTFFEDYSTILDICRLILNQQLYSSNTYNLSQWCLLFPMEYIFEDFIAGFIQKHFSKEWSVESQESKEYLTKNALDEEVFLMRHDIFMTENGNKRRLIIDTKYKLRDKALKKDDHKKKGIDQVDLYQMTSYAFRRGCAEVILIYPNISEPDVPFVQGEPDIFTITSGFDRTKIITIKAYAIPFWSMNNFNQLPVNLEEALRKILN